MTTRSDANAPSAAAPLAASGGAVTVGLCFLVAVLEGFDIQAMGVAAPKLGAELKLAKDVLGEALAASNIGLVLGAILGGWLADQFGRKAVLIGAVLGFGAFTLLTMLAQGFEMLFLARLFAGFGFGAALPNLMALSAEVAPEGKRGSTGTMMFCGMPLGGGIVALISWLGLGLDWRHLFLIGGLAPLLLAPLIFFLMKEPPVARERGSGGMTWRWLAVVPLYAVSYLLLAWLGTLPGMGSIKALTPWLAALPTVIIAYMVLHRAALFGEGRALPSVLLWAVFFPTLLILYLVLNWLPTLVIAKGFAKDASLASVWFNFASVVGALILGRLVDRFGLRWPMIAAYVGLVASLMLLARANALAMVMALSGAVGFFVLGANYALYGAAASYYPAVARGRGSGAAVAWGRLGSVAGPLVGGSLLQGGASAGSVVSSMTPFAVAALVGVFLLTLLAKPKH
jgi:AAHS family 3-hydroxyphenylpropionic acid transporter